MDLDAARKQVRMTAPELARTRSGEQKPEAAAHLVENHLHRIENCWDALDFVEEDRSHSSLRTAQLGFEPLGLRDVVPEGRGAR